MAESLDNELRRQLLQTDEEFRAAVGAAPRARRTDCITWLSGPTSTNTEQVEEVTLKKRKLQLKDQMEDILRRQVVAPKSRRRLTDQPASRVAAPASTTHRGRSRARAGAPDLSRGTRPPHHDGHRSGRVRRSSPARWCRRRCCLAGFGASGGPSRSCCSAAFFAFFFRDPERVVAADGRAGACRRPTAG